MDLENILLNNWVEYEGGSEPRSNIIRFVDVDDQTVRFELQYDFDKSEDDVINLGIDIPRTTFEQMIENLQSNGRAILEVGDKNSSLYSEWRTTYGDLELRMSFRGTTFTGPILYQMKEYKRVLI